LHRRFGDGFFALLGKYLKDAPESQHAARIRNASGPPERAPFHAPYCDVIGRRLELHSGAA
jgi:hypothetical protein